MPEQFKSFHHYFINNTVSRMVRGIADYFGNEFFERSQEIVIASYEKGVQHFKQRLNESGEKHAPKYPFIVFDPSMDFEPDPQAGRFFHGYPNFVGVFASYLTKPTIYEDNNIIVAPILNRYKGRFDIVVWCSSIYELIDFRFLIIQMFGGQDRLIYPKNILGQIILPDELVGYEYGNPYTEVSYDLDWEENKSSVELIRNINQNRMVYPFEFRPWIKLLDVGDGAEKYGGSGDELSDHRLNISLEWECSIPTHIGLLASKKPIFDRILDLNMDVGYTYKCDFHDPNTGEMINSIMLADTKLNIYGTEDSTSLEREVKSDWLEYKDRYNYFITQDELDKINSQPVENFILPLEEPVENAHRIRIYGKYGPLKLHYHWELVDNDKVEFRSMNLKNSFEVGDVLWFAIYDEKQHDLKTD